MNYKVSYNTNFFSSDLENSRVIECEIDLPSSKSISNRLLIIQALCEQEFKIHNLSNSKDTSSLQNALKRNDNIIDVGAAGTSFRFLTSLLCLKNGQKFHLTGSERMKRRPIKQLVESLRNLGAKIEYNEKKGVPPLNIFGQKLKGGETYIDGSISSQFISSLLLISPALENGLKIKIIGKLVSKPYIQMTLRLMNEFGVSYTWKNNIIEVKPQKYIAKNFNVEGDWSAASFWFEIAALSSKCNIKLNGLFEESTQGDINIIKLFKNLGVKSTFEKGSLILTKNNNYDIPESIDLLKNPDLYQPIICAILGLSVIKEHKMFQQPDQKDIRKIWKNKSKFTGISTLKDKESNRVKSTENQFFNLISTRKIDSDKDHRMAMSFAPLSLIFGEFEINDVEVVKKSYPNFWKDLEKAGFIISPLTRTNN